MLHKYIGRTQWHKWWELPTNWWQTSPRSTARLQKVTPTCYNIWMQVSNLFKENWRNWKSIKYIDKMLIQMLIQCWFLCMKSQVQFVSGSVRRDGRDICKFLGTVCTDTFRCWLMKVSIFSILGLTGLLLLSFLLLCSAWLWVAILFICIFAKLKFTGSEYFRTSEGDYL